MRTRTLAWAAVLLLPVLLVCGACTRAAGHTAEVRSTTASTSGHPSSGRNTRARTHPRSGRERVADPAAAIRIENARPGHEWRLKKDRVAGPDELSGYANRVSVTSGETFTIYVTATVSRYRVRALRLGYYGGVGARQVWLSHWLRGRRQPAPTTDTRRTVSTDWKPSLTIHTNGWPDGEYLLRLEGSNGHEKYIPITVRSKELRGRLVLVSAVTTYQAYNTWGGYSLYTGPRGFSDRSYAVSFDRPYDENGARIPTHHEQPIIFAAERLGLPLGYVTSTDIQRDPNILKGAVGVVSMGHDEYWSVRMRQAVRRARGRGSNLAFLGANAIYWRVRFASTALGQDRLVIGYKSAQLDPVSGPSTTALWRDAPNPRPENSLVGMLYECFPAYGDLAVRDPGFFLFHGTGVRRGSTYHRLVGIEVDRAYPIRGTPKDLQVVTHSRVSCGSSGHTYSDMTYYTTPSGAGVFSAGSMLWAMAVGGPVSHFGVTKADHLFARKVTDNLLRAMARGPMGRSHPSHGNLASVNDPATTSTGTGGPVAG